VIGFGDFQGSAPIVDLANLQMNDPDVVVRAARETLARGRAETC
jgi:hypothetical protein